MDEWEAAHPDEGVFPIEVRREMLAGLVLLGSRLCRVAVMSDGRPWTIPVTDAWIGDQWPLPQDRTFIERQRVRLARAEVLVRVDSETDLLSADWFSHLPTLAAVDWAALRRRLGVAALGAVGEAEPCLVLARLLAHQATMRALDHGPADAAASEVTVAHAQAGAWCGMSRHRVAAALATLEAHGLLERRRQHGKHERVVLLGGWWHGEAMPGSDGLRPAADAAAVPTLPGAGELPNAIDGPAARSRTIPQELLALVVAGQLVADLDPTTGRLTFRRPT